MTAAEAIVIVCAVITICTILCGGLILMTKSAIDMMRKEFREEVKKLYDAINDLKHTK